MVDPIINTSDSDNELKFLSLSVFIFVLISLLLPTVISISFQIIVMVLCLVALNEYSSWSLSHPFAFLSISFSMSIVGPLIDYLFLDSREATWALLRKSRDILVPGGFVALVGLGALIYGFGSVSGVRIGYKIPGITANWNRDRAIWIARIYAIIGLIGFAFVVMSISFTDISSKRQFATVYIRWIVQFLFFGGLIAFITLLHHNQSLFSLTGYSVAAAFGLFFIYGFLVSSRSTILWNSILLLAIYVQYRQVRAIYLIGIAGVFTLLSSTMLALRANASTLVEYLLPLSTLESVFGANRGGITAISHLVEMTPDETPFRYGRTMIDWIVFPIPRALWEDKPVNVGSQLASIIYGANNGTPPGLIGDLYWNFWLLGVIIGMLVLGVVLRTLVEYRSRLHNVPTVILITTILMYLLAKLPVVTPLMVSLGLWLVPLIVAVVLLRVPPESSPSEILAKFSSPISSSVLLRTGLIILLAPYRLKASWQNNRTQRATPDIVRRGKQVATSSWLVTAMKRFDQKPEDE